MTQAGRESPWSVGEPPAAEVKPVSFEVHGTRIRDDYAWLKAENWKDVLKNASLLPAPIADHLKAENAFTAAALRDLDGLRERLVAEMRGRIEEDESSVPQPDGRYAYSSRYREGAQHPLICREPRDGGADEVLLDADQEAAGTAYFDLAGTAHSPDHARLAWSADRSGSELYTIRVRDLATGRDGLDEVLATSGDVIWTHDGASFYYVEVDTNHRPVRVRRHALGTSQADDALVYEERETGWFVSIDTTTSRRFMVIRVSDHETSESWLVDLGVASGEPRLVAERTPLVLYSVEHHGQDLIIGTNADGAEDFKLMSVPLDRPARENWQDLVPHRPGIMVLFHAALRPLSRAAGAAGCQSPHGRARGGDRRRARGRVRRGSLFAQLRARDSSSTRTSSGSRIPRSQRPTRPTTTTCAPATRRLRKRQQVPSGFDGARYVTRRVFGRAPDGESVPISLVYPAGTALDGSAPCLLYGYGSYGSSMPASFRTNLLSLVDRGFVYAIAHVRGGTEKGWRWYLDGKREKKPNTFTDFIACADALVEAGYTSRGRIVAFGGSAGGMLMGVAANIGDDRFAGIVADVPFVDVLNTMLDGELPLTPPEWPEWGNPGEDEAAFRTILSYSPYDNVRTQPYPAILALGGLTDPRVTYWEPAKWGRAAARDDDGGRAGPPANQHGGRAWRCRRPVRAAGGGGADLCLRAEDGGPERCARSPSCLRSSPLAAVTIRIRADTSIRRGIRPSFGAELRQGLM